jgi:uncharacterized repeat protein (TIGR04076 family)
VEYKVILEVKNVKGECAAGYKAGDKIVLDGFLINTKESCNVCLYAMGALLPYLTVLHRETSEEDWINQIKALQCPDPSNTVIFTIRREKSTN